MRLLSLILWLGVSLLAGPGPRALHEAALRIRTAAQAAGVPLPLRQVELRIHKEPHLLELWSMGRKVKVYPVALGHRGLADKVRQGDHLTPEGTFRICTRNAASQYHLFLGLSYPEREDADRGLKTGLITPAQRAAIVSALSKGACPPWETRLGGQVGLHGGGIGAEWTWGCVALENPGIEELWTVCAVGTPVVITRE